MRKLKTLFTPITLGLLGLSGAGFSQIASAATTGYYDMCYGYGEANHGNAVTQGGNTAVQMSTLSAAELAGVQVLSVYNCDNGGYSGNYTSNLANIQNFVSRGGVLMIHDRYVDVAETILPGGSAFDIRRDFSDDANIDVLDGSTRLTNGPGGAINNSTLDGGTSSSHGFTIAGSLPVNARLLLSQADPSHIVTFSYPFGRGQVIYSSIPLDFYVRFQGYRPNFEQIYAPNAEAYAADLYASRITDTASVSTSGNSYDPSTKIYRFTGKFCNKAGMPSYTNLATRTTSLSNIATLNSRTRDGSPRAGGAGSEQDFTLNGGYGDGVFSANECANIDYAIGLTTKASFTFTVDLIGKPAP